MASSLFRPGIHRTVFTQLLIIGIVPLCILAAVFFFFYVDGKKQGARDVQKEIAEKIAWGITAHLKTTTARAAWFADAVGVDYPDGKTLQKMTDDFLTRSREFDWIVFTDAEGNELAKSSRFYTYRPHEFGNISDTDGFREARSGRRHFSRIVISQESHFPRIQLTLPVVDPRGRFMGALAAGVNVSRIWDMISRYSLGPNRYAYVVDTDGILIAYRDLSEVLGKRNLRQIPTVREYLKGRTGVQEYVGLSGDRVIGASAKVSVPEWAVVVEEPVATAYRDIRALTLIFAAIWMFTLLAALVLGLRFSSLRIIRPIRHLKKEANAIAKGDLTRRIHLESVVDEFGELAEAFNRMVADLKRTTVSRDRLAREIEVRKAAEAEIRKQRDRAQRYLDISGVILLALDDTGRVTLLNRKGGETLGYPESEISGRNWFDLAIPPEDRETVESMFFKIVRGDLAPFQYHENRIITRGGDEKIILWHNSLLTDETGRITGTLSSGEDVTLRRQAEAERIRLATAIEQAAEVVIVTDSETVVQYVNPAFEAIFGYDRREVIGRKISMLQSGKHDKAFYRELMTTIAAGEVWSGHFINRRKDGECQEMEASISPIRDARGRIINYVSVQRDVTRERRMERQLQQTHKMEAIGTLAGGIAHDFNNILTAIMGFTEICIEDAPSGSLLRGNLEEVLSAANRAKDLVTQILAFCRQTDQHPNPLMFSLVVKEALKLMRATLPATIEIRTCIDSESWVRADPTQMHQILMNLCTNAAHAIGASGVLDVRLTDVHFDMTAAASFGDIPAGGYVLLSVSDSGPGIPEEIMDRIFDPFFTTKEVGEGTGMGLAVVHGIVAAGGGAVRAGNKPGGGAVFEVVLPMVDPDESAAPRTLSFASGGGRILLVDDEAAIAEMGRQMFSRLGYQVRVFTSARDALAFFEADPGGVDLVFTDMTMPEMTGRDLAGHVIRIRPDTPVVLCTGYSDQISAHDVDVPGVRHVVRKPYAMSEVARILGELTGSGA